MIELLLSLKDALLNLISGGKWSQYHGDRRDYYINEE